jgi:hypothetical protein
MKPKLHITSRDRVKGMTQGLWDQTILGILNMPECLILMMS